MTASVQATVETPRAPVLGVGAVVIDRTGAAPAVLVVKRAHPPAEGSWSLPGGRVQAKESLAEAVRREIAEETGLVVRPGPLLAVVELIDDAYHFVVLDYLCIRVSGEVRAGDDAADAKFIPVADLGALGVTAAVHDVVHRALSMLEQA